MVFNVVSKFTKNLLKRHLSWSLSRSRRRRSRRVDFLQRGSNGGGKRGNISPACSSSLVLCKIRYRRSSRRRSTRIRGERGKQGTIIIKWHLGGSNHRVGGVGRHDEK
jgi:hypothetical protein